MSGGEWDWFDALPEEEKRAYAKFRSGNRYDDNARWERNILAMLERLKAETPDDEDPPEVPEV
ncbi:MAG: hypothetical protein M3480_00780 [Verrucomicrobiota bacterium]|nr:hypothetical protein [Verrucomicrobiota bacterium]